MLIKPAGGGCNMRCRYCFYCDVLSERGGTVSRMTDGTAAQLIKKAFGYARASVSFAFQGGEPTLAGLDFYRRFVETVGRENKKGLAVRYALQTNGVRIDGDWAAFLKAENFLTGLSLDGPAEIHDLNRVDAGGGGTHRDVMRAARALDRAGAAFNILSVITAATARHIGKIYAFYKKQGFKYLQFIPCLDGFDGKPDKFSLRGDGYEGFLKRLFDLWYDDFLRGEYISIRAFDNYIHMLQGLPPENCAMGGACGVYYVVEGNGDVYPCDFYCIDSYRLGNLGGGDFTDFERSAARERFAQEGRGHAETCGACRHYDLCRGGCRRERDGVTRAHRFCGATQAFFDYARPRMSAIADSLRRRNAR
ncbi:MAG: SPASM domain-containing protein [Clostridiales bacterium]|nr:SPASM domain-containing protein [Clostridiales bacterium]